MGKITNLEGHQILDSKGHPTIEVKITTEEGYMVSDSVPSGLTTGSFETVAVEPKRAEDHINNIIAPKMIGLDPRDQEKIDQLLLELDGTPNRSKLGANALLGVSLATARAGAMTDKKPLFWHLNHLYNKIAKTALEPAIPTPMMVMIEGGKHGNNNLCIQEFLCLGSLEDGEKIWKSLEQILVELNITPTLGSEGGFAPKFDYDEDAFDYLLEAISRSGLKVPENVKLGLDVAGNHCQIGETDIIRLMKKYPIYSLEDPAPEEAWQRWADLKHQLDGLDKDYLLVGDDIFVTNELRLESAINNMMANAIIIKANQAATLTETLKVIALAQKSGFTHIVSHRAHETMDTFIADLAVATAAKFLKAGAPFAGERLAKYERLKEISEEL